LYIFLITIKGRGIHKAVYHIKKDIHNNKIDTQYYIQLDVKKFYPSVDNEILKQLLRNRIKDKNLIWLLDEIIDSTKGLPIGNLTSQILGNFYLSFLDRFIKEELKVKFYYRYADDLVLFSRDKRSLHEFKHKIEEYLKINLNLRIKENWKISKLKEGLDFIGYVFFPCKTMIRKSIKLEFIRSCKKLNNRNFKFIKSINSYLGWLKHCDSNTLITRYISFDDMMLIKNL